MSIGRKLAVQRPGWAWVPAALVVALTAMPTRSEPHVARVARGRVTITRSGLVTDIHASNRSIIDYRSFDVARGETVRFFLPSASARVLNRIYSSSPSCIYGRIWSNGVVYFASPAGVLFGPTAVVDVAGLCAAAGSIATRDFVNGQDRFRLSGAVVNQGTIRARSVHLMGRSVVNSGSIVAEEGTVAMLAGGAAYVGTLDGHVFAKIDAPSAGDGLGGPARAAGAILGAGDLYSVAARNSGTIVGEQIVLAAEGGQVEVSGRLDASGPAGGGTIRVSGDSVHISPDATVRADATESGDGGSVTVKGERAARVEGTVSARGGPDGGQGGFVETSGGWLRIGAAPDVSAQSGRSGTWLIDPYDLEIVDEITAGSGPAGHGGQGWLTYESGPGVSQLSITTILAGLNTARIVIVRTGAGGQGEGNITWSAGGEIDASTLGDGGVRILALEAHNDITFAVQPDVTSSAPQDILHLVLIPDADRDGHGTWLLQFGHPRVIHAAAYDLGGLPLPRQESGPAMRITAILAAQLPPPAPFPYQGQEGDNVTRLLAGGDLSRALEEIEHRASKDAEARTADARGPTSRPAGTAGASGPAVKVSAGDAAGKAIHESPDAKRPKTTWLTLPLGTGLGRQLAP